MSKLTTAYLHAPISISRGVKQGSVLSPSFFLVVMNSLLQRMRSKHDGGSLHGIFAGTAVHADDVRSIAPSIQSIISQYSDIHSFTSDVGLKLNASKLEVIQISQNPKAPVEITLGNHALTTKRTARCLGIQWQSNLSANESVSTNITKARKTFFGLGSTGVFHGNLNPLSSSSIYETCVLPILLYGCETWLLDSSCLQALEKFQCEIGRRILKLPKYHANVRCSLNCPTLAYCGNPYFSTKAYLSKQATIKPNRYYELPYILLTSNGKYLQYLFNTSMQDAGSFSRH